MLMPGVSSMIRLDLPICAALSINCSHSASDKLPVRRCWESTWDSMENRRFTSCSLDISRLNIATVLFCLNATYSATFRTNAVFPMEGLAATRIKSEGCSPAVL